jgi:DMSO/TMAO reductase YedYZ molybdopterin-dependent catalytic subunit
VSEPAERRYGRAAFLALLAGGASSFLWAAKASGVLSPLTSGVSQLLGNLFPIGGWRIYTISGSMPVFDERSWRLDVTGLAGLPRSFTYSELAALPRVHEVRTFHCVTGWTVHNVRWSGVRLSHLLDLVEPYASARAVRFVSLEQPYNDSLTLEQARMHDVLLALEMDGKPLSRPHGSPVRVVIPEMYGYKGVKWLTKIELLDHQPTGYWEGLGYDQNAWVGRSNGYHSA